MIESVDYKTVRAIVSLDPAGTNDCGVAVRFYNPDVKYKRGKLPTLDYTYQGSVWEVGLHDGLALCLSKRLTPGERVLFVHEGTNFGSRVSLGLGRAIGCVEGLLIDINVMEPGTREPVAAGVWRRTQLPGHRTEGLSTQARRESWKAAAVAAVNALYGTDLDSDEDDVAEAILLGDHAILHTLPKLLDKSAT